MGAHSTPPGAGAGHLAAPRWEDPAGGGAGPRQAGPKVAAGAGHLPQAVMPRVRGREVSKGGTGAAGRGERGKAPRQAGRAPGSWERQAAETGGHMAAQGSVSRSAARLLRGPLGSAVTPPHPPPVWKRNTCTPFQTNAPGHRRQPPSQDHSSSRAQAGHNPELRGRARPLHPPRALVMPWVCGGWEGLGGVGGRPPH